VGDAVARHDAGEKDAQPDQSGRKSDSDLSIGQVLAATGATTLGTILVKFLDLWGTVLGAAALSVCTSIGAVLILRGMRRTGDRIKTQLAAFSPAAKAGQGRTVDLASAASDANPTRVTATAAVPSPVPGGEATRPLYRAEPVGADAAGGTEYTAVKGTSRKRTLLAIAVSSVLVFALTMGLLILLGGVTGDPGRFVHQPPAGETATILDSPETPVGPGEDAPETGPGEAPEGGEEPSPTTGERPDEEATTEAPTSDPPTEAPTEEPTGGGEDEGVEESPAPEGGEETPEAPDTE
jgi:hypothetical protein